VSKVEKHGKRSVGVKRSRSIGFKPSLQYSNAPLLQRLKCLKLKAKKKGRKQIIELRAKSEEEICCSQRFADCSELLAQSSTLLALCSFLRDFDARKGIGGERS
jgi:hypothetical protein